MAHKPSLVFRCPASPFAMRCVSRRARCDAMLGSTMPLIAQIGALANLVIEEAEEAKVLIPEPALVRSIP